MRDDGIVRWHQQVRSVLDPAIGAMLAGRERRAAARALAARDPLAARELQIGRPDLPSRDYDDGGLVDLNAAPVAAIATACELPAYVAAAIVAGRPYRTVDDVVSTVDIPLWTWSMLRERGIVISPVG